MAIIDIEILHCDLEKRNTAFRKVIDRLGPPDGSVVVTRGDDEEFGDEAIEEILALFDDIGEIILVRFYSFCLILNNHVIICALCVILGITGFCLDFESIARISQLHRFQKTGLKKHLR